MHAIVLLRFIGLNYQNIPSDRPGWTPLANSNRLFGQARTIPIYAHNEESYIRDDYGSSCRRLLISQ